MIFTNINLETQYKGFNLCFWVMTLTALVFSLAGQPLVAVMLGTLGLVSGAIGQLKLILINQNKFLCNQEAFLANQAKIESKIDELLEEDVQ